MEAETKSMGVMDEAYRPLPPLYFVFMAVWLVSACSWTINTYKNRHFQRNKLQWTLASVPVIKALQLSLAAFFWYSCFNLQRCSVWMAFGVYVTGVLFQTASFVSFLLISHGYCIMCEHLSISERRTTAALGFGFYLTLVGYRASIPYFKVLLLVNYFASFYLIFHHISRNLLVLREQLTFVEDQDVYLMHDAIYTKYVMFKKFQGAMQVMAVTEILVHIAMDCSLENYWVRLLFREWAYFCIFLYIGYLVLIAPLIRWTFRSQDLAPRFSLMPRMRSKEQPMGPPIYSVEMDAETFKDLNRHEWQIGVPTPSSPSDNRKDSILVVVQHPHACRASSPVQPQRPGW